MFRRTLTQIKKLVKFILPIYQKIFAENDKIATGETIGSLRTQIEANLPVSASIDLYGSSVIKKIEEGRQAGEVLVEDGQLTDWMIARGIPLAVEPRIAMSIYNNPLAPVPITKDAKIQINTLDKTAILLAFRRDMSAMIERAWKKTFGKQRRTRR